mgnify:CR=1 FL=1
MTLAAAAAPRLRRFEALPVAIFLVLVSLGLVGLSLMIGRRGAVA